MSGLPSTTLTAFRGLQHLLPGARAWLTTSLAGTKQLTDFLLVHAQTAADAREFIDSVYLDLFPNTTRELAAWEDQFALSARGTEAERRLRLAAAWAETGGQDPRYLEDTVRAAGFDVRIYEWWYVSSGFTITRDPRNFTDPPLVGTVQCGEPDVLCGEPDALMDEFLANDPGYIVNDNLEPLPPPVIPSDSEDWPYFIYWAGDTIDEVAAIPEARRDVFYEKILQLSPAQQWLVTYVDFYDESVTVFDQSGDPIQDQGGETIQEQ